MNKEVVEYLKRTEFFNMGWTTHNRKPMLRILVWDEKRQRTRVEYLDFPFPPYFYMKVSDYLKDDRIPDIIKETDYRAKVKVVNAETTDGWKVAKIEVSRPSNVSNRYLNGIRDKLESEFGIQTFEGDIPYRRRVMMDLDLTMAEHKRKLYIDIEVDARAGFPNPDEAKEQILCIGAVDYQGHIFFFCGDDERKDVIEPALDLMRKYTMVEGWNVSLFDLRYLGNRCKNLGIPFDIFLYPHMDVLDCYKVVFKRRVKSYRLVDVCKAEHLETQIEEFKPDELWRLFNNDREELKRKNIGHAGAVKELDEKFWLAGVRVHIARVCHTLPYETLSYFVAIDGISLNIAKDRKPRIVYPTRDMKLFSYMKKTDDEKYLGAIIFPPIPGIHKNVLVIDFRGMYLYIIRTFNIGLDTFRPDKSGDIKAPIGSFTSEFVSLQAEVAKIMEQEREIYRNMRDKCDPASEDWFINDRRQWGIKYVGRSLYGVIGAKFSRWYKRPVAEDISVYGRTLLKFVKVESEKLGFKVLYGDTDSVFIEMPTQPETLKETIEIGQKLVKHLNKRLIDYCKVVFGVSEVELEIELDKVFQALYLPRVKKRYAGIVIWEKIPCFYLHVKGFEVKRRDWPRISQFVQEELFKKVLTGANINEIKSYLAKVREELLSGEHIDKLTIGKTLTKEVDKYESDIQHVRVAKQLRKAGYQARVGDRILFVVLGPKKEDVVPARFIEDGKRKITKSNYAFIWKKYVKPIVERMGIEFFRKAKLEEFV